ncbi:Metal-dependent hydrolase, endonuclease/exonuclease/phosphatase family [Paenibacillus sp. cl141a]|uniref:endonuclease/exonuclease/phosphatase family protein n=1 Tax=Paenibacillus sp. cl141a TaxID=1761877 RepID=UPI0008C1089A|nr:endonuclease/exonuclease/phosphatase family protein [Paenibacillus sp. cl141a]SEK18575.1 Metal-dependent hydrolase, endonuclease/exonuclease/phosphatase family [Paenibacillus sp. cl141a]
MRIPKITSLFMMLTFLTTASLSASGEMGSTAEASSGPLKVMSFNLRYAANDSQPWEKRRPVTRNLILEHQPDVIGTQEGLHRQIVDLENDLPGYDRIGVGREGGSLGEYMAIFYNTERLRPLEQSHFWLSDTPQTISSASWGNQIPRMATWVRFQDLRNGKTFYMVNTHLDHQSEVSRQKSAALIVDKMKAFDPDIPVVITGDFNTLPGSDTYSIFTSNGLSDAHVTAKKRTNDDLGTFHNYKDPTGGGSGNRIDWILHGQGWNVLHSEIINYKEDGQYPSDHYPVMMEGTLQQSNKTTGETVPKQPLTTALHITEVVANSNEQGNYNYVEIYNPTNREIDLEGYQIYYYYDPALPFDKSKSNRWTITKDRYSTNTLIGPNETKVVWIKKQPCCYDLGLEQFLANYHADGDELLPSQVLAVFTPGNNQGLNGTSTSGRSLGISSPSGTHLVGVQFNNGQLDAGVNESITYQEPEPLISIMQKKDTFQRPSPGQP